MNKLLLKGIFLIGIILIFSSMAFATGPATVYKVTIATFEIWNGTAWVTVSSGNSVTIDIASVTSGSAAGTFFSGLAVPDGVYTQVRVTPSATFTISGNDGANYTTAAIGPGEGSTPTLVPAQQAECTITLTGGSVPLPQITDFSATPITVKDGAADRKVRVSFDVSNAISYTVGLNEIFPAAPAVTMSAQ